MLPVHVCPLYEYVSNTSVFFFWRPAHNWVEDINF